MVEITPEIQAQLDEAKKNCIFCKIISGEMESKQVYSDDLIIGVLDINPCVKGHVLLLPKEHYPIIPFLPPETFKHMFGLMPQIVGSMKKAMLSTGANVFIANGGVAGQQSPHFLLHVFSREKGDGVNRYGFTDSKGIDEEKAKQSYSMLANNLPLMMKNHFGRNPASWHTGNIETADALKDIKEKQQVIYEDEKVLCVVPQSPQCIGHLVIYSQEEEQLLEHLDNESSAHLFFTASFCATAVFEGLGAQGSNIILKSGVSDDNPTGKLAVHILPRSQDDGLDVLCPPMQEKPDLDEVASRIKDELFLLAHGQKKEEKEIIYDLDAQKPKVSDKPKEELLVDTGNEILDAINKIRKN